jgi:D-alanine-D-alanine ligase
MAKMILLLFGGESPEHEVSIMSAQNVVKALYTKKYSVLLGYIDLQGQWWHVPKVQAYADTSKLKGIEPVLGDGKIRVGTKTIAIDTIFPVLHGSNGEDGTVQALAKLMHVPVVGCGVAASAICMDKVVAKQLLAGRSLPVVPYVTYELGDEPLTYKDVMQKLGKTLFIKPARLGSSVGVSKVSTTKQFVDAIDASTKLDSKILIEQAITGRELEVAVLGGKEVHASVVGEIVPDREFYDYESKYDSSSETLLEVPAGISQVVSDQIRQYALWAFKILGCSGLARIDFFFDEESGTVYVNEVNTMPELSNTGMYAKLCEASGTSYTELVDELIGLAK